MAGSRRLTDLSSDVLARVEEHLPVGRLVVALSGGADSAAGAWATGKLRSTVRAIHIDHGQPASRGLQAAARAVADQLGLDLSVVEIEPRPGASPEGQARIARYEALEGALTADEWLITGHTMDDQAETILGNLLRGAGAVGLMGIPKQRGRIVRPLLGITRTETRELATLLGLPWRDDPTNLDLSVRRNVLRREVIPYVEARLNPAIRASLIRTAAALDEAERVLQSDSRRIQFQIGESGVRLPAPLLATVPRAVATRAVRRALREVRDDGYPGSSADVSAILAVAAGGPPVELAGSVRAERHGVWLKLERPGPRTGLEPVRWPVPGHVATGSWVLDAWIEEVSPIVYPLSSFVEVFDADHLPPVLTVRPGSKSDRVSIVGGTKPLADAMAESGVPSGDRPTRPVVVADDQVIWVPGVRRADIGWVGSATRRYLWVRATVEGSS